jgi:hypothetical protein
VAVLKHFTERKKITFPLLSDADSALIRAFGILNESVTKNSPFFGIPHPVTYIIDPKGRIVSHHFEEDFRKRLTVGAILSEARPDPNAKTFQNDKLRLTASASDAVVRGGEVVRLFLDVRLGQRMHVYAPGVEGYIPVSWRIHDTPAAEIGTSRFPDARKLHLKAIGETVPVYEKTFRIERDIIIQGGKEVEKSLTQDGNLVLQGVFRYQACDDRTCYVPEDVPLRWSFHYQPHDSTRVPPELRKLK